jgi:hypothetical protein
LECRGVHLFPDWKPTEFLAPRSDNPRRLLTWHERCSVARNADATNITRIKPMSASFLPDTTASRRRRDAGRVRGSTP